MKIDSSIFKAYDVRGIYPTQLNEDTAYAFGRGYATFMHQRNTESSVGVADRAAGIAERPAVKINRIAIGSDARVSSPALKERLIAGLTDSGLDVDDIGLVSSPTFYFAVAFYGYAGGIQVSASHNPKEWNGFKVVAQNAFPISGTTGLQDIAKIIEDESFLPIVTAKGNVGKKEGVVEDEVQDQAEFALGKSSSRTEAELQDGHIAPAIKPFKIVIDAANGMGSQDMAAFFKTLPCEIVPMNFDLDGTFPAHEADPLKPENTKDLQQRVLDEKADLGIAIDGDGDRYFFIDELGQIVPQRILRGLMAQIELAEHPGARVAYDIRPGRITADIIANNGGNAIITPVGHSIIKEIMIREGAIFGGESSGHYFYKLPYGTFEAPMVLVAKLLRFLSAQDQPLSEILKPFDIYAHSGEINLRVASREQAQMIIGLVKSRFKDGELKEIDGITIEYPDFWFNLRASNTEPLLRFTLEAKSKKIMEVKRDEILEFLKQF